MRPFLRLENEQKSCAIWVYSFLEIALSLELPLIIEFYEEPEKVEKAIQVLQSRLDFKHIITWPAMAYLNELFSPDLPD